MQATRTNSLSVHRIISSLLSLDASVCNALRAAPISASQRFFSDTGSGGDSAPSVDDTLEAPPSSTPPPPLDPTDSRERKGPTQADLMAQGFTKRQATWISPDPEKQKHFLPKLSRKEVGNYGTDFANAEFGEEVKLYPKVPNVPLYNLREVVPEIAQPRSDMLDALLTARESNPNASILELAAMVGVPVPPPDAPPPPGLEPILEWEVRLVLTPAAVGEAHPVNKKAKCRVHMRALQKQFDLSDGALMWMAEIAGPRYNRNKGILTLTSEKYAERELNREHIVTMLDALVQEGLKYDGGSAGGAAAMKNNVKKEGKI